MDPTQIQFFNPRSAINGYHRNLPHWRQNNATYFVTFHLADSIPSSKHAELKLLLKQRRDYQTSPPTHKSQKVYSQLSQTIQEKIEKWLDAGYGSCLLANTGSLKATTSALTHLDGQHYELIAYVVMPNHCHLVIHPQIGNKLETILQRRKSFIAREVNGLENRKGQLWHEESYDRIIRDESHLYRVIRYIENNPKKANLAHETYKLGISAKWKEWYEVRKGETSLFIPYYPTSHGAPAPLTRLS